MTGCKIIKNRLTWFLFVLLLGRGLLLLLGVVRVLVGFAFTGTSSLLLRAAFLATFGLGSPGCRLLAFVLPRLNTRLPSRFGG